MHEGILEVGGYGGNGASPLYRHPFGFFFRIGANSSETLVVELGPEWTKQRCREASEQIAVCRALMTPASPCCRRHDFARCASDLGLEHHQSIVSLIQLEAFGTAAALLRPLLEASAAAWWLTYAATNEEVLALPTSTVEGHLEDLPLLTDMGRRLEAYFPPITRIVEGFAKKGTRSSKWLHQYTHGGTPQLLRRQPAGFWTNADVSLTLVRADIFGLLAAALDLAMSDNAPLASYLYPRRDQIGEDLHLIFGAEKLEPQARSFPKPTATCCGDPLFK